MSNNIENQGVTLSGTSNGPSDVTASHLADLSSRVVLSARRTAKPEAIVSNIRAAGDEAEFLTIGGTYAGDVQACLDQVAAVFGIRR